MGAKRYLLIVWLAFSVPWIAGTGIGVYKEPHAASSGSLSVVHGACASEAASGKPGAAAAIDCSRKSLVSLAGRALDAAGGAVHTDSSRSADSVRPVHNVVDGFFVLGPPLLLLVAYSLILLAARLRGDAGRFGIDGWGG